MVMKLLRRGRIIKVRLGYNANSSSLAAYVTYFLWGSAALVLVLNTISAAIFTKRQDQSAGSHEELKG